MNIITPKSVLIEYLSLNPESRISRLNIMVSKSICCMLPSFPSETYQWARHRACTPVVCTWEAEVGGVPTGSRPAWCKYWAPGQARATEQDFAQKQRNKAKNTTQPNSRKQKWATLAPTSVEIYHTVTVLEGHPCDHLLPPGAQSQCSQAKCLFDGFSFRRYLVREGQGASPTSSSRYISGCSCSET